MTVALGHKIRQTRTDKSMTQAELAERLAVTQTAVACWETGTRTPRYTLLLALLDALSVSESERMWWVEAAAEEG